MKRNINMLVRQYSSSRMMNANGKIQNIGVVGLVCFTLLLISSYVN